MANLVKCKDCGHEVSEKAKTCPNCGVKKPAAKGMSKTKAVLLVIVAIAAVSVFMDDDTNTSSSRRQAVQSPEGVATQAEEAVVAEPVVRQAENSREAAAVIQGGAWYAILGWDDATCITSSGPMLDGPLAEDIEHRPTEDDGVVVTYWKSSGKIGGVYFLEASACGRLGEKYRQLWETDRG